MSCSICTASQLAAPTDIFAKDHKKTTHSRERPRTPRALHLLIPTVRGQRRKPKNLFFAKKALVAFFPRPISAFFEIYKMCILLPLQSQQFSKCKFLKQLILGWPSSQFKPSLNEICSEFHEILFREISYQAVIIRRLSLYFGKIWYVLFVTESVCIR